MKEMKIIKLKFLIALLFFAGINSAVAQETRWLRVNQLQSWIEDYGSESEYHSYQSNFNAWPAQYGDNQYTSRGKALWFGAKNFYDPVEKKQKQYKVTGTGPRFDPANTPLMVFPQGIKLVAKTQPPLVVVDGQIGTNNGLYDTPDEIDESIPGDRMIVTQFNTSMGISVTKKVIAFTQSNHDNYYIYDYVIKNTGIYNAAGDKYEQTLTDFWVYEAHREAFSGVTSTGYGSSWGAFASEWGTSTVYHDFGPYRGSDLRGWYSFYGPCSDRTAVTYAQDWGCPNNLVDGLLGSAKYAGAVTLFVSKSPQQFDVNDMEQPRNTAYNNADATYVSANVSQYDEAFMKQRYDVMSEDHLDQSHMQSVGDQYVADWRSAHPDRDQGGGAQQGQGYGPYTLAPGDSIRIVYAEGVNGISWEKCREVGANWFQYFQGLGTPTLKMPDGSTETSYTKYTRAWVETGIDSIMQTFNAAKTNYESGYNIPSAPPAPANFTVVSGGNKINLSWSGEAASHPNFNGYVIYRSEGNVKDYRTRYTKIFECDKSYTANTFDDVKASRGFNYFYFIQSKDDGKQADVKSGPIYSSLFLTMTTVPAYLRRPPAPTVAIPPDQDSSVWKIITPSIGEWTADSVKKGTYKANVIVDYNGAQYYCTATVIDSLPPDSNHVIWKKIPVSSGAWAGAKGYEAYNNVTYMGQNYFNLWQVSAGLGLELVRVVPNPYDVRNRYFQFNDPGTTVDHDRIAFYGLPGECNLKIYTERGDLIWEKSHTTGSGDELWNCQTSSGQFVVSGIYILYVETPDGQSVIRKFVIVR